MDACLITILIVIIIFAIGIFLLIKFGRRPKILFTVSNRNIDSYRQEALNKLTNKGYRIKEKQNGDIFVQKDTFSATTLVLKQNGPNVDVCFIHSNSGAMATIIIVCIFTITIFGLILAVIADSSSKSFRND